MDAKKNYRKKTRQVAIEFNIEKEMDLFNILATKGNKQGYLKDLIRKERKKKMLTREEFKNYTSGKIEENKESIWVEVDGIKAEIRNSPIFSNLDDCVENLFSNYCKNLLETNTNILSKNNKYIVCVSKDAKEKLIADFRFLIDTRIEKIEQAGIDKNKMFVLDNMFIENSKDEKQRNYNHLCWNLYGMDMKYISDTLIMQGLINDMKKIIDDESKRIFVSHYQGDIYLSFLDYIIYLDCNYNIPISDKLKQSYNDFRIVTWKEEYDGFSVYDENGEKIEQCGDVVDASISLFDNKNAYCIADDNHKVVRNDYYQEI